MEYSKLTMEQAFQLKELEVKARSMTKERLVNELLMLQCRFYTVKGMMESCAGSMGVTIRLEERTPAGIPESLEELSEMLGRSVSTLEAEQYMHEHVRAEAEELDMEAIALGAEE